MSEDAMRRLVSVAALAAALGCSEAPEVTSKGQDPAGTGSGGDFNLKIPEQGTGSGNSGNNPAANSPTEATNCGLRKLDLQRIPAELLVVLDRSGSMMQPIAPNMTATRWPEVAGALDQVIQRTQAGIHWGLKLYPTDLQCGVGQGVNVQPALNSHNSIMNVVQRSTPVPGRGATPTQVAVRNATGFMGARQTPNPKYLLLATDGLPNCFTNDPRAGAQDVEGAIKSIADAAAAGLPTFVVGIATAGTEAHQTLNQMAIMGGRPRDNQTRYYPVSSREELVGILDTIAGQLASCTFSLDPPPPVPENIAVEVDGKRVAQDTTQQNGWSYGPGNRSLQIFGPVCDQLKSGAKKTVQIIYGCPGQVIP
jgi:hypothetical protein